jgi:hypothetical protein
MFRSWQFLRLNERPLISHAEIAGRFGVRNLPEVMALTNPRVNDFPTLPIINEH